MRWQAEKDASDAPVHMSADEAAAWAQGYNACLESQRPPEPQFRSKDPECPFTMAHTRRYCGFAGCGDS